MLNYANEFNLPREDVNKVPGEIYYVFGGVRHDESVVVDEFRDAVAAMQDDLHRLSGAPTADLHNDADVELDLTNLREYLEAKVAGPVARAAIDEAYVAEFGLETHRQSCLNFLLFIHLDKRSKFTPFGIFSDERFHIRAGNDLIAKGIRDRLPGVVQHGMRLVRIQRLTGGEVELTFTQGSKTVTRTHGAVVITIPFTVLRDVEMDFDPSVPAERDKRIAIDELGYGTNAKQMIRFNGRPWADARPSRHRHVLLRPPQRSDHVGDEPVPGDRHPCGPHGLRERRSRRGAQSEQGPDGGRAVPGRPRQGLPGGARGRLPRFAGQVPGPHRALAVEPADEGELHLLPAGPVHQDRRQRRKANRQHPLRRRARELVLRLSGIHGGRGALGDRCFGRDPGEDQGGGALARGIHRLLRRFTLSTACPVGSREGLGPGVQDLVHVQTVATMNRRRNG